MLVTQHAIRRIGQRLRRQGDTVALLERTPGEPGVVAYILGSDPRNGDITVAVAIDGSVETVYHRRKGQDMTAAFFGARRVIDMRRSDVR